jgi:hypothetical protein
MESYEFGTAGLSRYELMQMGKMYGIMMLDRFERREDLVRTIQLAAGKKDCFKGGGECSTLKCMWKNECLGADLPWK